MVSGMVVIRIWSSCYGFRHGFNSNLELLLWFPAWFKSLVSGTVLMRM